MINEQHMSNEQKLREALQKIKSIAEQSTLTAPLAAIAIKALAPPITPPAAAPAPAVPQGWKLVPIEPTPEMGRAYLEAAKIHAAEGAEDKMRFSPGGYAAMLSAAPSQPVTLTDDKIEQLAVDSEIVFRRQGKLLTPFLEHIDLRRNVHAFANAIIAALREKEGNG